MESLIAPTINLLLLLGILGYKLRGPLRDFVSQRHHTIRAEVQAVAQQLEAAQAQFDELSAKIKSVDLEVAALRDQSRQDAQSMQHRIVAEAKRLATTIVSDARSMGEGLYYQLKVQLYRELSSKVVDRAEFLLKDRLTGEDHSRIGHEFSLQVERMS